MKTFEHNDENIEKLIDTVLDGADDEKLSTMAREWLKASYEDKSTFEMDAKAEGFLDDSTRS